MDQFKLLLCCFLIVGIIVIAITVLTEWVREIRRRRNIYRRDNNAN